MTAELKELEAAATKGPWDCEWEGDSSYRISCAAGGNQEANARLIAAMRNALPDLLEAVEALKFYASASWSQLDDDLIQIGSFMHPGRRARAVLSRLEERS